MRPLRNHSPGGARQTVLLSTHILPEVAAICSRVVLIHRGRKAIDLRVYERGTGETLACGTGACAAVVAGQRLGLLDDAVTVSLPGGQLVVSWRGNAGDPVWLAGDAERTSEGSLTI